MSFLTRTSIILGEGERHHDLPACCLLLGLYGKAYLKMVPGLSPAVSVVCLLLVGTLIQSVHTFSLNANFSIIRQINQNGNSTWSAGTTKFHNNRRAFSGTSGTKWLTDSEVEALPQLLTPRWLTRSVVIPHEFDAREKWPNCSTIRDIRDQGGCGSCWAHAVSESLSDRICIVSSNRNLTVRISVEDLMTCCPKCGGCNGGIVEHAFEHFITTGLVTGGDFSSKKGCRPYSIDPNTWIQPSNTTPKCTKQCYAGYRKPYSHDIYKGASWHVVSKLSSSLSANSSVKDHALITDAVRKIQLEILTHGPVTCSMQIHEDFLYYEKGVYSYMTGSLLVGHAMKIIGWGVDEATKVPYWLISNSWGREWGEAGFVRVRRGVNECLVESRVNAGLPVKINHPKL